MGRVRVLLLEVPRLLREILEQAIQVDGECELVKDSDATAALRDWMPPDVVVLGLTAEEDATLVPALFARWPRITVMTVTQQGDAATLYQLRPNRRVLGEMSPSEITSTLRDTVRRGHRGSTSNGEDNDWRMGARGTMQLSFRFLDLRCYADPSDGRSYYMLPSTPDLRRDSSGHPMITVLDVGSSGYAMFTATWSASGASVEALRRKIASGCGDPDASRIRVSFAPVSAPQCHALVGDGSGTFQTIATSATSGMPPYDAVFNLAIPHERLAQVKSAVKGEGGFLAIEYIADLLIPATASAAFRSQSSDLLPWLRARRSGGTSMRALLEEAVELGLATVTIDALDHPGGQIAVELFDRVLTQAAEVALRWITEGDHGHLEVEATVEREVREPVRAFADIGGIIARGSARPS